MLGNETIFTDNAAYLISTLGLATPALARISDAVVGGQALASIGLLVLLLLFPSSTYLPGTPGYQALKDVNWSVPPPFAPRPPAPCAPPPLAFPPPQINNQSDAPASSG